MKRSTPRWSTAMAAAALCILPATGWTQTNPTTAQQPPASATDQRDTQQAGSAQEHLRQAKQALNDIQTSSVTGQARTQLTELRRHMTALERFAAANDSASATAAKSGATTKARGNANWGTEVAAIDRILSEMLGPASGASSSAGTGEMTSPTGTTGASGAAQGKAGAQGSSMTKIDEATRAKLTDVRTHITAFAAAMSGSTPPASSPQTADQGASSSTDPSAASASNAAATTPSMTTGATTSPQAAPASGAQTGTTAEAQPGQSTPGAATQAEGQAQIDAAAAKRHLTEARDALSQLTQLPAAAQLTGDARTQVSQLITNFNELITTGTGDWHPAYAKVSANLDALIGATQTAESATPTTGTAGAVGTTGTATGSIDPAIRAKLVEFRTHLSEFEKAAGGSSPASGATAGTMEGTTGSSTSGSTGMTSQSPTGTSGSTADQSATSPQSEAMGHGEAMRHVEAIEAILNGRSGSSTAAGSPAGTTGSTAAGASMTLDRAQIEQVRTHLAELRRLLTEAEKK